MLFDQKTSGESSLICIQDTVRNPCFPLVSQFITEYTDKEDAVYVFSYDNDTNKLGKQLGYLNSYDINMYDCIPSLPLDDNNFRNPGQCSFLRKIEQFAAVCGDFILVIHSLSTLILCEESFNDVYVTLRGLITKQIKLNAKSVQVLAVVHEDMLLDKSHILNNLKHLSRMWIIYDQHSFIVEEKTKKAKEYEYSFKNGTFSYQKKIERTSATRRNKDSEPKVTFSVDLVEDEKETKQSVELPFTKKQGRSIKSEIVVDEDEEDWDDEEPDNDLQI